MLHIVLYQPRIPQNSGNIGRLCVALNAKLHFIYPLGFRLHSKETKRSALDYWEHLEFYEWNSLEHFWEKHPQNENHKFFSTKAGKIYFRANFKNEDFLYFGREDKGLPEHIIKANINNAFKVPMNEQCRSLNLSNSVGIVAYEAYRQINI